MAMARQENSGETQAHIQIAAEETSGGGGELKRICDTPLHVAALMGRREVVMELLWMNSKMCLVKDKFGRTPLHIATMKGVIVVMRELLNACPESLTQVTAMSETPLHTAVVSDQGPAFELLLDWLQKTNNIHLINTKDHQGNTILHLATSRKQLRTIEVLLVHDPRIRERLKINATNAGGFTALDILDVLPQCGKLDMEIGKILGHAGALRARDIAKLQWDHHAAAKPNLDTAKYIYSAVLLTATLFATITFRAALYPPSSVGHWEAGHSVLRIMEKQNRTLTRCFIFFNSMGFFASVAMILLLMHAFPWKPWLFISVSSLVGSYMCSIIETSPTEGLALVLLGSPFVLLATAPGVRRMSLKCMKWGGIKNGKEDLLPE